MGLGQNLFLASTIAFAGCNKPQEPTTAQTPVVEEAAQTTPDCQIQALQFVDGNEYRCLTDQGMTGLLPIGGTPTCTNEEAKTIQARVQTQLRMACAQAGTPLKE